jgi:hypothetical protein
VIPLKTQGMGDVEATEFQRIEGEVNFVRYYRTAAAFGLGAEYSYEKATWAQTTPVVLSDTVRTQDLSLNLFWRLDF